MALVRWNPWSLDRLMEEGWDMPTLPFLSRVAGQGLNLYETEGEIVAEAAVPGIPEDRIDVSVDGDLVRVTGSSEENREDRDKRRYFMSSMNASYTYAFRLPEGVVPDTEPACTLADGVLTLSFPKTKKAAPKKVKVTKTPKQTKA